MKHEFEDRLMEAESSLMWLQENLLGLMDNVVRMRLHFMYHFSSLNEQRWHELQQGAQDQLDDVLLSLTRLIDRVVRTGGEVESARMAIVVPMQQAQQRIKEELERRRKKDNK